MIEPLSERVAVFHVHSAFSDGSGRIDHIARAATAAGVDAVVVSDHNTLDARRAGFEGYVEGALIVVGMEVSRRRQAHVLALDVPEVDPMEPESLEDCLQSIRQMGGLSIVAHPEGQRTAHFRVPSFDDWSLPLYDGIEIWSYMHDWIEGLRPWKMPAWIRRPHERIDGPKASVLAGWDQAGRLRRVVGVGALDAHARRVPLTPWRVFPYRESFETVRTHLLTAPPTGHAEDDIPAFYDALRAGRCFVSYWPAGDARGFRFGLTADSGAQWPMGSEVPYAPGMMLLAESPLEAEIALLRNGQIAGRAEGFRLLRGIDAPGVYRVELRRDGGPWVFSNPVYVR